NGVIDMAPTAGFVAKVVVNGQRFSCASASVSDSAPEIDVSNTEGVTGSGGAGSPPLASNIASVATRRIRIRQASFDPATNWYLGPRNIGVQSYYPISVYPNGLGGKVFTCPNALCVSSNYSLEVRQGQPIELEFVGDGLWSYPV